MGQEVRLIVTGTISGKGFRLGTEDEELAYSCTVRVASVDHIAVNTPDLDRFRRFYEGVLGLRILVFVVNRHGGMDSCWTCAQRRVTSWTNPPACRRAAGPS